MTREHTTRFLDMPRRQSSVGAGRNGNAVFAGIGDIDERHTRACPRVTTDMANIDSFPAKIGERLITERIAADTSDEGH